MTGGFSALGLGWLGAGRIFAAPPGWKPQGAVRLAIGMVADTHIRTGSNGVRMDSHRPTTWFVKALEHFRDANVDAVVHLGDMAHCGQTRELEFHAMAWRQVFPGDCAADGRHVEKLFVTGNHDTLVDNAFVVRFCPDPAERARRTFATDQAANWKRVFGEEFQRVWHKSVKGFHFVGLNHGVPGSELVEFMEKHAAKGIGRETKRPLFLLMHVPPSEELQKSLARWPSAVGFYGHCHASAANWNVIGCLPGGVPFVQCPALRAMPHNVLAGERGIVRARRLGGRAQAGCNTARQGFVVRVYEDYLAIERREFTEGGRIGEDWIMPLGRFAPHPFERAELKKSIGKPQFRPGAKLQVLAGEADVLKLRIPAADGNPATRAYAFDVGVAGNGGGRARYWGVYAAGACMGAGHEANGGVTELEIPRAELPAGDEFTVFARPVTSLGSYGEEISLRCRCVEV